MRKAGGIVALIAGLMGTFAGIVTLLFGGLSSSLHVNGAQTVVVLGWLGLLGSFLTIVLGAVAINARTSAPGWWIIVCSIVSAIFGGTLVAIFMVLALIGGILTLFSGEQAPDQPRVAQKSPAPSAAANFENGGGQLKPRWSLGAVALVVVVLGGVAVGLFVLGANRRNGADSGTRTGTSEADYTVDQDIVTSRFKVVVHSELRSSVGSMFTQSASSGAVFVAVKYSISNITDKPLSSFALPRILLVDQSGSQYSPDTAATVIYASEVGSDEKFFGELSPNLTWNKTAVFEVSRKLFDESTWRLFFQDEDTEFYVSLQAKEPKQAEPEQAEPEPSAETSNGSSSDDAVESDGSGDSDVPDGNVTQTPTEVQPPSSDVIQPERKIESPLQVVTEFYRALGKANGEEAAHFIVPEKRLDGPLSAAEITRFYSSLRSPLVLIGVKPIGNSQYEAHYTFVQATGVVCDGTSIVTVVTRGEEYLIEHIKALNGC